jgi:PIN domain nuclease of toxin-antitoxin system
MDEIIMDTIVFDYLTRNRKAISRNAIEKIENADVVYVSVTSIWELSNHVNAGLIPLQSDFNFFYQRAIQKLGLILLDTQWVALNYLSTFKNITIQKPFSKVKNGILISGNKEVLHKDPFDRMLIAHAISMNLPIVSPDSLFPHYSKLGLKVIW